MKKTLIDQVIKKMQIYEILQLLRIFIFLNHYMIDHYQFLLFIINVTKCNCFIFLSLYNIYLFLCSFHYFYKNILN